MGCDGRLQKQLGGGDIGGELAIIAPFLDAGSDRCVQIFEDATGAMVRTFLQEYYPRNAWPSEKQRAVVEQSLDVLFEVADADVPGSPHQN